MGTHDRGEDMSSQVPADVVSQVVVFVLAHWRDGGQSLFVRQSSWTKVVTSFGSTEDV